MAIAPSQPTTAADGLLGSLDPEQRAAATLPDGPALIIAPAGSGETTTLIARLGVLLARGWSEVCVMGYEATEDYRLRSDVPYGPKVDLLVRRFIDRDLVYRTGRATYAFALSLFRGYIRQREFRCLPAFDLGD